MYVQDLSIELDNVTEENLEETIKRISKIISTGDVQYAYPYAMKEFLIKYATYILLIYEKRLN